MSTMASSGKLTGMSGTKLRAGVALGLFATVALSACAAGNREHDDSRTEIGTVREIVLAGGSGSIRVERGSGSVVSISRHYRYRGKGRPVGRDRLQGDALRVVTDCGRGCHVDYVIAVPTALNVRGANGAGTIDLRSVGSVAVDAGNGTITVREASGDVNAVSESGNIEVHDAKRNVTARAESGSVRVHRAGGTVVAEAEHGVVEVRDTGGERVTLRTSSGAISVVLNRPQTVRAVSHNGPIRVSVPAGTQLDVRTAADDGRIRVDVPVTKGAPNTLDLQSRHGDIAVVPV